MASISFVGRVGQEPEIKHTDGGLVVCSFSVAEQGSKKDETNWWNCTAFGKTAETIAKYFPKGSGIYVHGEVNIEEYQEKKYTKVIVSGFKFVPSSKSDNGEQHQQEKQTSAPAASFKVAAPTVAQVEEEIPF